MHLRLVNSKRMEKKAYIKTYGCQMNEQDSAQMQAVLGNMGFAKALDPFEADLILINTCSIREKAVHKIYSELGRLRPLKEDKPDLIVGVAGCVAEQEKTRLSDRYSFLDLVFGPDHIRRLPDMIRDLETKRANSPHPQTVVKTGFDLRKDFQFVNVLPDSEETPVKAFVNIQKGCDNICSFCIVPFVRGREVSRSHGEIIEEIKGLTDRGVKEVTLLGQNVNSYGLKTTGGITFAQLLGEIAEKTRLKRLRFTTSHPKDVGEDLITQFRDNSILAPHFHLPVQSGSNRILELMRRQYTREDYLHIVNRLREEAPQLSFSTDLIVSFPTETEAEFQDTMNLVQEVRFDFSFSFVYSPRPYTKAVQLKDDVSHEEKLSRLKRLQELTRELALEQNEKDVGLVHEILVEEKLEGEERPFKGRTATNKIVHFEGEHHEPGDFVKVLVTQANAFSLLGKNICQTKSK